jgi:hypothetical protein
VATLVARNPKDAIVVPMVGSGGVCVWWESGVRRSVLCQCVWQGSGFSRLEDVFTFFLRNVIIFVLSIRFVKIMLQ